MKYFLILALLCLLTSPCWTFETLSQEEQELKDLKTIKYQCSFYENFSIFSYKLIENRINDTDFSSKIVENPDKSLYFSFCNDNDIECSNLGPSDVRGSVMLRDNANGQKICTRISSDKWNDVTVKYITNELDRKRDYLRLSWNGIDKCDFDPEQIWSFTIDVVCSDVAIEDSRFYYTGGYDKSCHIKSQFESKLGCAIVSYSVISDFLNQNRTIFAISLIVAGAFLCVAGYRIILITIFLATILVTVGVTALIAFNFFVTLETKHLYLWLILAGSIILGIILGALMYKFRRIGICIIAFCGGVCIGFILNNAVMRYAESNTLFWIVLIGCGLACAIIAVFLYIIAAIVSTSLLGSYMLVRGVSVFVGHFPNEMTLIEQIKNGTIPKTEWQLWAYLAVMLIIFIASLAVQWKTRPERNNKKNKTKKQNGEFYRQI